MYLFFYKTPKVQKEPKLGSFSRLDILLDSDFAKTLIFRQNLNYWQK